MKILKNKQGAELTLSTVIIAVLVIVVLIVLIAIFSQGSGGFWNTISSCEDRGGTCDSDTQSCIASEGSVYRIAKCKEGGVCCVPKKNLVGDNQNEYE